MSSFVSALQNCLALGLFPVIPDLKRHSPKEGELFRRRDPLSLGRQLVEHGAPALSVVTESRHFKGELAILREVAAGISVPILRKDFLTEERDVTVSRQAGAAAILLIAAFLPPTRLSRLREAARREGLEVLVEVHTEDELYRALKTEPDMLGINNRDILRLETDEGGVEITERLAPLVPKGVFVISESGLSSPQDMRRAARAGARAAIVGTALWRTARPEKKLRELMRPW